jgi:hypothetical protein
MAFVEDLKIKWAQMRHQKQTRDLTPEEFLGYLTSNLASMTAPVRKENIELLRAQATMHFEQRHHVPIPEYFSKNLDALTQRSARLERVDEARKIIAEYGWPTRETIMKSLERSQLARQQERENSATKQVKFVEKTAPVERENATQKQVKFTKEAAVETPTQAARNEGQKQAKAPAKQRTNGKEMTMEVSI